MKIKSIENMKIKAMEKYEGMGIPGVDSIIIGTLSAVKYASLLAGVHFVVKYAYLPADVPKDENALLGLLSFGFAYCVCEGIQKAYQRQRDARNFGILEETLLKEILPEETPLEENLSKE